MENKNQEKQPNLMVEEKLEVIRAEKEKYIQQIIIDGELKKARKENEKILIQEIAGVVKTAAILGTASFIASMIVNSNENIEKHRIEFGSNE